MFGPQRDIRVAYRLGAIAIGAAVTGLLALTIPPDGGPTPLDRTLVEPIHSTLDARPGIYQALVIPSNGYILLPLLLLVCGWFAYQGDLRRAGIMLVIPELTLGLNALLWKPLWDRQLHDYLAYPSGHTVHLVAIATTFILLVDSVRARVIAAVVAAIALLAAAIGMIGLEYHWPTDILGGAAAAITMVLALCWAAQPLFGSARAHWQPTQQSIGSGPPEPSSSAEAPVSAEASDSREPCSPSEPSPKLPG